VPTSIRSVIASTIRRFSSSGKLGQREYRSRASLTMSSCERALMVSTSISA